MKKYLLLIFVFLHPLAADGLLQNKFAFVTGGSSGIGRAIVEHFVEEGAQVIFTYHQNEEKAKEMVQRLNRPEHRVLAIPMNILDEPSVLEAVDKVAQEFPHLDVLVNNAAILAKQSFLATEASEMNRVMQANVTSPFLISQHIARQMIQKGVRGSIIHIGSFRGERPVSRLFAYSTSKAALNAMTLMMAHELAPQGIRVNLIAPGGTLTAMSRQIYDTDEKLRLRGAKVPLQRYGRPEDHVGLAAYLASDASSWTTGTIIPVDGGESTAN